ncbi:hypothetical protein OQA88_11176 [Cercophora sp. LCS_1]
MPRVKHHRSSRRVPPPKDSDFDHEINLVDHSPSPRRSEEGENSARGSSLGSALAGPSPEGQRKSPDANDAPGRPVDGEAQQDDATATNGGEPPLRPPSPKPKPKPKSPETAIDILYENQRGGFLCGIPLFSSKALGNLDPTPWTNFAHKPSPTDINTAQVPDPSWEWAWPEWKINYEEGVADEDGWEYSFMFSRKFSWHKASWWNSFVRRRAWIRKRVEKNAGYMANDGNVLNLEYFTVRPSSEMDRGSSRLGDRGSKISLSTAGGWEMPEKIEGVDELLAVLRASRIDREKIEAVDNYLANASDELAGLEGVMHDVMAVFVFQASRRVLLSRLTEVYDQAVKEKDKRGKMPDGDVADTLRKKVDNLAAAVKHADEEVRRLEYWSDVKGVVGEAESKGAVDKGQGWDEGWQGLDRSGPKAPKPKHSDGSKDQEGTRRM